MNHESDATEHPEIEALFEEYLSLRRQGQAPALDAYPETQRQTLQAKIEEYERLHLLFGALREYQSEQIGAEVSAEQTNAAYERFRRKRGRSSSSDQKASRWQRFVHGLVLAFRSPQWATALAAMAILGLVVFAFYQEARYRELSQKFSTEKSTRPAKAESRQQDTQALQDLAATQTTTQQNVLELQREVEVLSERLQESAAESLKTQQVLIDQQKELEALRQQLERTSSNLVAMTEPQERMMSPPPSIMVDSDPRRLLEQFEERLARLQNQLAKSEELFVRFQKQQQEIEVLRKQFVDASESLAMVKANDRSASFFPADFRLDELFTELEKLRNQLAATNTEQAHLRRELELLTHGTVTLTEPVRRAMAQLQAETTRRNAMLSQANQKKPVLRSPVSTAIRETAPTLRWEAFPGAESYRVSVTNITDNIVWEDDITPQTQVSVPEGVLHRGQIYLWRVEANTGETEAASIGGFGVIDLQTLNQVLAAERSYSDSAVTLASVYASHGLYEAALAEIEKLANENPTSPFVQMMLINLRRQLGRVGRVEK